MAVPASIKRRFTGSIAHDSAEILRREIGGVIVRVDPPFAYGRQMVVRADDGSETRVPFDLELVAIQRAAQIRATWHAPIIARRGGRV